MLLFDNIKNVCPKKKKKNSLHLRFRKQLLFITITNPVTDEGRWGTMCTAATVEVVLLEQDSLMEPIPLQAGLNSDFSFSQTGYHSRLERAQSNLLVNRLLDEELTEALPFPKAFLRKEVQQTSPEIELGSSVPPLEVRDRRYPLHDTHIIKFNDSIIRKLYYCRFYYP